MTCKKCNICARTTNKLHQRYRPTSGISRASSDQLFSWSYAGRGGAFGNNRSGIYTVTHRYTTRGIQHQFGNSTSFVSFKDPKT
ncbi:hypothetical protein TKK_0001393 [Trichogramma kaykai]